MALTPSCLLYNAQGLGVSRRLLEEELYAYLLSTGGNRLCLIPRTMVTGLAWDANHQTVVGELAGVVIRCT